MTPHPLRYGATLAGLLLAAGSAAHAQSGDEFHSGGGRTGSPAGGGNRTYRTGTQAIALPRFSGDRAANGSRPQRNPFGDANTTYRTGTQASPLNDGGRRAQELQRFYADHAPRPTPEESERREREQRVVREHMPRALSPDQRFDPARAAAGLLRGYLDRSERERAAREARRMRERDPIAGRDEAGYRNADGTPFRPGLPNREEVDRWNRQAREAYENEVRRYEAQSTLIDLEIYKEELYHRAREVALAGDPVRQKQEEVRYGRRVAELVRQQEELYRKARMVPLPGEYDSPERPR